MCPPSTQNIEARQEREIKDIQIRKEEIKLFISADDMIVYIENTKESTKKSLRTNKWVQQGHRIGIIMQKPTAFLYTSSENIVTETENTIPLTFVQ